MHSYKMLSNQTVSKNAVDANPYTSIRIRKSITRKLDKIGTFKERYPDVIERLADKELGLVSVKEQSS